MSALDYMIITLLGSVNSRYSFPLKPVIGKMERWEE